MALNVSCYSGEMVRGATGVEFECYTRRHSTRYGN